MQKGLGFKMCRLENRTKGPEASLGCFCRWERGLGPETGTVFMGRALLLLRDLAPLLKPASWMWPYRDAAETPWTKLLTLPLWSRMWAPQRWDKYLSSREYIHMCIYFILFCFQEIIAAGAGACSPCLAASHCSAYSIFYMTSLYFRADESYIIRIDFLLVFFSFHPPNKGRRGR